MARTYVRNEVTGKFEQIVSGGLALDSTLSKEGQIADAKAVGDAIARLAESVNIMVVQDHTHTIADISGLQDSLNSNNDELNEFTANYIDELFDSY
jgi:hypothetical protein